MLSATGKYTLMLKALMKTKLLNLKLIMNILTDEGIILTVLIRSIRIKRGVIIRRRQNKK